jgi:hypothetical protein
LVDGVEDLGFYLLVDAKFFRKFEVYICFANLYLANFSVLNMLVFGEGRGERERGGEREREREMSWELVYLLPEPYIYIYIYI